MTTPPNPSSSAPHFSVVPAQDSRTERVIRSKQSTGTWLVFLFFGLVVALLPLLFYTYWVVLEAAVRAWNLPHTRGILTGVFRRSLISPGGWPFDVAFVIATLNAWGLLYLGYDHLSLFGNRAMKDALLQKAKSIYPYTLDQSPHYFVEIRPPDDVKRVRRDQLMPDIGWLFLTPDALVFAGNDQVATISREQIREANRSIHADIARFGLSASWVRLPYGSRRSEVIQLMARDDATRHSETAPGAWRLEKALNEWLSRT
ncbi:MAG: hypothetical protein V4671_07470 [Armatimonadota bacterium]